MRNLQQVQVRTSSGFEKICPFPIGFIYMSTNGTSPASTYGGTWAPLTDSRFLRPSGSWDARGGASTHSLTMQEMARGFWNTYSHHNYDAINNDVRTLVSPGNTYGLNAGKQGVGQAFSILPPYRTCYCWYRTG